MSITPYAFISPTVRLPQPLTVPRRNPHQSMAAIPEDYAIYRGRPRVPEVWCNGVAVVTADGEKYQDRPGSTEVTDDSLVSFVADDDSWDATAAIWSPYQDNTYTRYRMEADPLSAPILEPVEYVIKKELFTTPALEVSYESALFSNFNSGADDSTDFTVALAVNVRDITEEPVLVFGDDSQLLFTETGVEVIFEQYSFDVSLPVALTSLTPLYLVFDLTATEATLSVGTGPTRIYKGSTPITERTVSLDFAILGELDVFCLDLWGDEAPTALEIITRYSSALGAS